MTKTHLGQLNLTEIADNILASDQNRSLNNMILLGTRIRLRDIGQLNLVQTVTFQMILNRNSLPLIRTKSITAFKINMPTFRAFKTALFWSKIIPIWSLMCKNVVMKLETKILKILTVTQMDLPVNLLIQNALQRKKSMN